jgi:hypothetical protein
VIVVTQRRETATSSSLSDSRRQHRLPRERSADEAIGGYSRGAAQSRSGVDQNYRLELRANKEVYVSQVDAAKQTRDAGLQAASLRQAAAVIAAVGREISREVGQGMRIRF